MSPRLHTCVLVGKTTYYGPQEHVLGFFQEVGHPCPPGENTADFLLDTTTVDLRNDKVQQETQAVVDLLQHKYSGSAYRKQAVEEALVERRGYTPGREVAGFSKEVWNLAWYAEFSILVSRAWKNVTREPRTTIAALMQSSIMALIVGGIFFEVGKETDQRSVRDRQGVLFFAVLNNSFMALQQCAWPGGAWPRAPLLCLCPSPSPSPSLPLSLSLSLSLARALSCPHLPPPPPPTLHAQPLAACACCMCVLLRPPSCKRAALFWVVCHRRHPAVSPGEAGLQPRAVCGRVPRVVILSVQDDGGRRHDADDPDIALHDPLLHGLPPDQRRVLLLLRPHYPDRHHHGPVRDRVPRTCSMAGTCTPPHTHAHTHTHTCAHAQLAAHVRARTACSTRCDHAVLDLLTWCTLAVFLSYRSYGMMLSAATPTLQIAQILAPSTVVLLMMFGGFYLVTTHARSHTGASLLRDCLRSGGWRCECSTWHEPAMATFAEHCMHSLHLVN